MLKRIISSVTSSFSDRPFLESVSGTDRLFILELCNVTDFFNANELWEAQYSGNYGIIELKTGQSRNRLQNALNIHRMVAPSMEPSGKIKRKSFVFTDVIVRIPKEIYDEDVRDNGRQLIMLAGNLCQLHEQHLENLWQNRKPSYTITYHNQEKDRVICQFGASVFVPNATDKQIASIQIQSKDGSWHPLPQLSFWQERGETRRPAGIYMNQDQLIIGHSYSNSSICMPNCISQTQGSIHVNCKQRQAYGDGVKLAKTARVTRDKNQTTFELPIIQSTDPPLIIQWKDINMPTPSVCLKGYGLMRNNKISSWYIWLNKQGMPCDFSDAVIYFQGAENKLHARKHDQKVYTELTFQNGQAEFEGYIINEPPKEMMLDYIGFLSMPRGLQVPIADMNPNEPMKIGRSMPDQSVEIALDYFSDPQSIRNPEVGINGPGNTCLGQINFSREQGILTWQSTTGKLFIQQISANAPIYIIQGEADNYQETLAPNSGKEIELQLTDRLVIGTYILGFQAVAVGATM